VCVGVGAFGNVCGSVVGDEFAEGPDLAQGLAAMGNSAQKMDWAAMPRTQRRAGWACASWAGSLRKPLNPSMVLRSVA